MNLAIVTELFTPSEGGQEVRYDQLASRLVADGHSVTIYTIGHQADLPPEEDRDGVKVRRVVQAPGYINRGGGLSRNPLTILRFAFALLFRIAELRRADSVIFNLWPVAPQILCGPFLGKKAVVDWCELRSGVLWNVLYHIMAKTSARHIGVSEDIIQRLISEYGVSGERATAILSGIYASEFIPEAEVERDNILFFGRLSPHKNPLLVLQAYLGTPDLKKEIGLVIAGGGEQLEELRAMAAHHPEVIITGRVTDEEKVRLMQRSRLLVLPSRREGFPRVIAEAAATGTPVLTVDYPDNGSVGVVRRYGLGWVCDSEESVLSSAMLRHLSEADEWEKISRHGRLMAMKEFDWSSVTHKLLNFLRPK